MLSSATDEALTHLSILKPPPRRKSTFALSGFAPLIDSFLLGEENSAIKEVSDPTAISGLHKRSPLYLFGPTGVGKTAVAITLATRWVNLQPDRTYHMIHALDFARNLVLAIESDDMSRFREQFRNCHCLLIDNVHELASKDFAQSELVEVLNTLEERETLVLFTSTVLPPLLTNWNLALASRMMAGHSIEISYPACAARFELIKQLSLAGGGITESELQALCLQLGLQSGENQSALQLKGLLARWQHRRRTIEEFGGDSGEELLDAIIDKQEKTQRTPLEIAKLVARELRQTLEQMRGPTRKSSVVRARGLAMYLTRQLTDTSYQAIGEFFGNRDHTTVMHACRKTEEDLTTDTELARCADRLKQKLR